MSVGRGRSEVLTQLNCYENHLAVTSASPVQLCSGRGVIAQDSGIDAAARSMAIFVSLIALLTGTRRKFVESVPARAAAGRAGDKSTDYADTQNAAPDGQSLFVVGERMLRAALLHDQRLSLLVAQVPDLAELELVFGRQAADLAVNELVTQLERISSRDGVVVRTTPDTFALVMAHVEADELVRSLQARLGKACALDFEHEDEEILVVPDVLARNVSATESVEEAYGVLCRAMQSERNLQVCRQDYLRREREAHTIPMDLQQRAIRKPEAAVSEKPSRVLYPILPATIPMPMGLN